MSPHYLHICTTETRWLLQMTLGVGVLVFEQNSLYVKLESETKTIEMGRVVSARAFLKLYFRDIVNIDYINPVQVWQRVLHEEKEEGMLEMVGGEWICERRTAFPFLIMGSERSLPLPAFSIHPR